MRAVEGPLASVRSSRPETLEYEGLAEPLQLVWVALRASIRRVLDEVTIAQLISGKLPKHVTALTDLPDAWVSQ
jgi:DNA-binding IscR family transcriptional regulator